LIKRQKKKPRKRDSLILFSNLIEEQNALAPLRLTVKVKAKPKIVRVQVHLDFDYATNIQAKKIWRKGISFFSDFFTLCRGNKKAPQVT
jgi:hypothetical protein